MIRGHHTFKKFWMPYIGKELPLSCEKGNVHDKHAVAVRTVRTKADRCCCWTCTSRDVACLLVFHTIWRRERLQENAHEGRRAKECSRKATGEGTFARERLRENVRERMFARECLRRATGERTFARECLHWATFMATVVKAFFTPQQKFHT